MAPQVMHGSLDVMTSGCIFKLRSSHCVCHSWLLRAFRSACGVKVSPTRCSKLGDVCLSQSTGVAPFLLCVRQRRSGARLRARGHFVNIIIIMRTWQNAYYLRISIAYLVLAFARLFLPGSKHKMLCQYTPPDPARPEGVLMQLNTHLPIEFCPPAPPCLL